MTVIIKTSFYYGPLEILLKWLLSKELDPFKVKISVLSEEFLNYYLKQNTLSFKDSLEFLYALTFFLMYKTKALFDRSMDEKEEETEEKEERTFSFMELVEFLTERYEKMRKMYAREEDETVESEETFDPSILFSIFSKLIQKIPEVKEKLPEIPKIEEKIKYILDLLKECKEISFKKLILESRTKIEAIVIFLAILELIKIRKIRCYQRERFDDIVIYEL